MTNIDLRKYFLWYAKTMVGKPYVWGGDDPMAGFDCSGYVIECLQGVGLVPQGYDNTANGLLTKFDKNIVGSPYAGCLVFFCTGDIATHVEICISDYLSIGASGGGSKTLTVEDAIKQNAFIQMNPIYRGGKRKLVFIDPFMSIKDTGHGKIHV